MSQELLDALYIPRRRALELGFTHEGKHFGVPVWVEDPEGDMIVAAKCGLLEWVLSAGVSLVQFANRYREPGDEIMFAFLIRPIPGTEA